MSIRTFDVTVRYHMPYRSLRYVIALLLWALQNVLLRQSPAMAALWLRICVITALLTGSQLACSCSCELKRTRNKRRINATAGNLKLLMWVGSWLKQTNKKIDKHAWNDGNWWSYSQWVSMCRISLPIQLSFRHPDSLHRQIKNVSLRQHNFITSMSRQQKKRGWFFPISLYCDLISILQSFSRSINFGAMNISQIMWVGTCYRRASHGNETSWRSNWGKQ